MNRMRVLVAMLLAVFGIAESLADGESTSMRPTLVALQVENLEATARWYTDYLDFQPKVRKEFPEQQLKLAILGLGDFDLELVENARTLKRSQVLSGPATDITGFAKITFAVGDVARLFHRLKEKGATFAISLRDSNTRPDEQFFVVLDNEKNWLQFVGKK